MKVVINVKHGGFGLSDAAYEKLIEWGVPVQAYAKQERGEDGLWLPQPLNDGEVIFDRELEEADPTDRMQALFREARARGTKGFGDRYWEMWTRDSRSHPLIVRVAEELGEAANGAHALLKVVEIPDEVEYEISEYDGLEHVAEKHRTWS